MLTIKELPENERPYEKCEKLGPEALSDAELLAVIIRTGTRTKRSVELAMEILNLSGPGSGLDALYDVTSAQLMTLDGIGRVKAIQIRCVLELAKRIYTVKPAPTQDFSSPSQIADCYMEEMRHYHQEHLVLLMLNTKNRKIADVTLAKGTVNCAPVTPRDIFTEALRNGAVNIVLIHNHPSGDPTPSEEDIAVTAAVSAMGEALGIRLLDHIVIGDRTYVSLLEEGLLIQEKHSKNGPV